MTKLRVVYQPLDRSTQLRGDSYTDIGISGKCRVCDCVCASTISKLSSEADKALNSHGLKLGTWRRGSNASDPLPQAQILRSITLTVNAFSPRECRWCGANFELIFFPR